MTTAAVVLPSARYVTVSAVDADQIPDEALFALFAILGLIEDAVDSAHTFWNVTLPAIGAYQS